MFHTVQYNKNLSGIIENYILEALATSLFVQGQWHPQGMWEHKFHSRYNAYNRPRFFYQQSLLHPFDIFVHSDHTRCRDHPAQSHGNSSQNTELENRGVLLKSKSHNNTQFFVCSYARP